MRAPLLAAVTLHHTGGGIAAVSRLIWRALQDGWGAESRLITMFEHETAPATAFEKARYIAGLMIREALGANDWILFSHLQLAEVQDAVPPSVRRRYGVFIHGIEAWGDLTPRQRRVLTAADLRVANSSYTATRVMRRHPDIGFIDVCPLALPPLERIDPAAHASGRGRRVLVVGRMSAAERYKGHDELIEAWPSVVAAHPEAELVVVGHGDDTARLRSKAIASGVGSRIVFTGFVTATELDRLYDTATLFALPSRGEGFGIVYLEAMRRGLCCIGSVHDAAGEVIVDGTTGRLVDLEQPHMLADVITDVLRDDVRRAEMGASGRDRALGEFGFERFRARLLSLLPARSDGPVEAVTA